MRRKMWFTDCYQGVVREGFPEEVSFQLEPKDEQG